MSALACSDPGSAGTTERWTSGIPEVPEAVRPPPGHPRFPLFDGLRAIAALCVLITHTAGFAGVAGGSWDARLLAHLDIGVTFFFVISGFLLYRPFVAARVLKASPIRLRDYLRRRFLRIFPAYWLALTALSIFPGIYGAFSGNWWVYYGLLQNWPLYTRSGGCVTDALQCGINPTWTLAIEVGFYIVLPIFALAMAFLTRWFRAGTRWIWPELVVLCAIAVVSVPIVLRLDTEEARLLWFSPLGHGLWFAAGMALAALSVAVQQRTGQSQTSWLDGNRALLPWLIAVGLYLILSLAVLNPVGGVGLIPAAQYRLEYVLFGLVAVLLLVPAIFGGQRRGAPHRLLAAPVLRWLGLVSYGIFLWHWPIAYALYKGGVARWWPAMAFLVMTAVTLVLTLACASLSYYAVERPLMRFKDRRSGEHRREGARREGAHASEALGLETGTKPSRLPPGR